MKTKNFIAVIILFFMGVFLSFSSVCKAEEQDDWTSNGPALISSTASHSTLLGIAFSKNYSIDGKIFASAYDGHIYIYNKGGDFWDSVNLNEVADEANHATSLSALATGPEGAVFAGSTNGYGVFRSLDNGLTWFDISRHYEEGGVPSANHWQFAISPNFSLDQTLFLADAWGVLRSTDKGDNWEIKNSGIPIYANSSILTIDIVPSYQYPSTEPIFAGGVAGLFRSIDNGDSWQAWNGNLPDTDGYITSIAISPNYSNDHTLFVAIEGVGIFKSSDGGVTWQDIGLAVGVSPYLLQVIVSPDYINDGIVIAKFMSDISVYKESSSLWLSLPSPPSRPTKMAVSPTFVEDKSVFVAVSEYTPNLYGVYSYTLKINVAPVADAGPDQAIYVDDHVTLDGSGSTDADGDIITYSWAFTSIPLDSTAFLDDPTSVNPTFIADIAGTYVVNLVVNDGALDSEADTVSISTINVAPVADAGPDQAILELDSEVQLDGAESYDLEGDSLIYNWTIILKPNDSYAFLSNSLSSEPTFQADIQGDYVIELIVSDGLASSEPDQVIVSFENITPIADAGINQSVVQGEEVCFDGSNSYDANFDSLSYFWRITSKPEGSSAVLDDSATVSPCFTTDLTGNYEVTLIVNDGFVASELSTVTVLVITYLDGATGTLLETVKEINSIDLTVLKNENMLNVLTSKINAALELADQGEYVEALDKLQHDIIGKTDGCAVTGEPDKNDWIQDCEAQDQVYPLIIEAIEYLESM